MAFSYYLRGWIGLVGLLAIVQTIQCFIDPKILREKLYTTSSGRANTLTARIFGMWTLLGAVLRILCAVDINNKTMYNLTLFSFLLPLGHFTSEVFIYKTAEFTLGVIVPCLVSCVSVIAMMIGYWWVSPSIGQEINKRTRMKHKEMLFQSDMKAD